MKNPSLPAQAAFGWNIFPLSSDYESPIKIATADPDNDLILKNVSAWLGAPIEPVRWPDRELHKSLTQTYGFGANEENIIGFVDHLIAEAHNERATDIHIEPFEQDLMIRFRIDGLLYAIPLPPLLNQQQSLLFSRVKVLAEMDIAERRRPQDGRFRCDVNGTTIDVRVSSIPTAHGESLDLRLLPRERPLLGLEELGMPPHHLMRVAGLIQKPHGIVLVTGPTGHGKTTTLYACLSRINTPEKKIITLEDPIEVQLKGVNQTQVNPALGLNFSSGLRAILRQDPDVIMVGEIRDTDTAETAIRASLTGHLVFSTLHTNDAVGAIARLLDMGVESSLLASSLQAVIAQRLVRLVCSVCGGQGKNCDDCRGTGYRGRTGIFEVLTIDEELRQLIHDRVAHQTFQSRAIALGLKTLFKEGKEKVKQGHTTLDELRRVTDEK